MTGLGPFSNTLAASKTLQFSPSQGVNRLIIKVGVGISDSRLSTNGSSIQAVETVTINGTTFITTTTTNQNQSQATQMIPFLVMRLTDQLANNNVLRSISTGYQRPSVVQTKCGYVYQYQFEV